jgi:hypothetical protein
MLLRFGPDVARLVAKSGFGPGAAKGRPLALQPFSNFGLTAEKFFH